MCKTRLGLLAAILAMIGCAAGSVQSGVPGIGRSASSSDRSAGRSGSPIEHVVIIVQENRSVDDLFQYFPGANTVATCTDANGVVHPLRQLRLESSDNPRHTHLAFVTDLYSQWDGVPGHPLGPATNQGWRAPHCGAVPQSEVQPYYTMAQAYTFANNFFQTNQGPSYPAHQYLVSGTSACTGASVRGFNRSTYQYCLPPTPWPVSDNAGNNQGGCDSNARATVSLVSPTDTTVYARQRVFPCFMNVSIIDEAQAAGVTWNFYQTSPGAGYWRSLDSVEPVWCLPRNAPCRTAGSQYLQHVRVANPPGSDVAAKFIADIGSCGKLANITYVTPNQAESDHAGHTDGSGPSYVTRLVNAVGQSCFWKHTAIFITWDDWGGWFDHVCPGGGTSDPCPTPRSSYELGYRVPLIVVSPYARNGYIATNPYDFGSLLVYLERTFDLPSLGTADAHANDLTNDVFNYSQRPTPFKPFAAPYDRAWFAKHQRIDPPGTLVPDDDTDNG